MPKQSLEVFNFQSSHRVRTTVINGVVYFAANDVAKALGYKQPSVAVKKHCLPKGVTKRNTLTNGGYQELLFIAESNVFRLALRSRKPEAVRFEEWVMEDVLPSIRSNGSYHLKAQLPKKSLKAKEIIKRNLPEWVVNFYWRNNGMDFFTFTEEEAIANLCFKLEHATARQTELLRQINDFAGFYDSLHKIHIKEMNRAGRVC